MKGKILLQTKRLTLREFTRDDAALFVGLDQDPQVMKFVDTGRPLTVASVNEELLPFILRQYSDPPGLGVFAAVETASAAFVGWFHFWPYHDNPDEIDLGYRLHRRFWGLGYATEGSRALIAHGFGVLGLNKIVAHALAENQASTRVMQKCGLTLEHYYEEAQFTFPDKRGAKYCLYRRDYGG